MRNLKKGFIMQILIIVIALIALGFYLKIDIFNFLNKPEAENVAQGLWNGLKLTWGYIKDAVAYIGSLFN